VGSGDVIYRKKRYLFISNVSAKLTLGRKKASHR